MNQKLIIEAYKSIEYKGGEKLGNITVQINPVKPPINTPKASS